MVIPAYNAERFLPLQLEALDMQSDAPPYEVIVVDNRSSDGTAALVDRLAEEVSYPLRRVSADQHQGPGYARNVGAAHARADLLMFADADDVVSRWWVRNGALAFETSVLWSGGARFMTDEEMIGGVEDIRRAAGDSDAWSPPEAADADEAFPVLMGGDFGVTRDVFLRIGGFDHSLGGVYEDNDLGIRAHLAGVVIDHAPDVRIAFRGKWDEGFRSRLARRSARSHALVAHRYGLTRRSHFPNPWGELARSAGAAVLMASGRKNRDWEGVRLRAATALGHAHGTVKYQWLKRSVPPQIGLGLDSADASAAHR